ncbi:SAF domain-containing protein [Corynebacterium lubricantis]|uniref:SAF domain-containing protein n=1 Tax=Corynebacterium lubricantis TaxID=541095 RepID=UPI00035C82D4|nr:SAF domain-containing protein [Corynebacterium lubricantis]
MSPKKLSSRDGLAAMLEALRSPGYQRTLALRRFLAATLVLIAVASLVTSTFSRDPSVVTLTSPVEAGSVISEEDVRITHVPRDLMPHNAVTLIDDAVGRVVVAHGSEGQFLTSVQLLGEEYSAAYVSQITDDFPADDHTMVPIKLAEPDIIHLLHQGATVNIVSTNSNTGTPDIIATGGRVVFAGETDSSDAETVLILLPEEMANAAAAASLTAPLTVILTESHKNI